MASDKRLRDMEFALKCSGGEDLARTARFSEFSFADFVGMLSEARKIAEGVIAPVAQASDREGARYFPKTGRVATASGYKEAYRLYSEGGWAISSLSPEWGGIGLPESVAVACSELFIGACSAFTMAPGLTRSALDVIVKFGTEEQKKRYVPNMASGVWTGTMCLTESHAGTDVGAIKTTATPIPGKPGYYRIRGTKIFISFGDHDLTENIVHLVLARTPDAPKGTKGISLFIVPKMKVASDGDLTKKKNDVRCSGIEHKMGIHGSPTCVLNFGDHDDCEGEILGEENAGMHHMFLMMNEARLLVGLQGLALGASAYESALAYAGERLQGVSIREFGNPNAERVPIIRHHDIRQKLMTMKAHTESMRALVYQVAHFLDASSSASDEAIREKYHAWVELLTPVVKAYCTDVGYEVADIGVAVHGGVGYCRDYPAEQYVRDAMITRIYEGTNGIQALDLLLRKIPMKHGAVLMGLAGEMGGALEEMKEHPVAGSIATKFSDAFSEFADLLMTLSDRKNAEVALINASRVLRVFGTIISGYYLLQQAVVASDALESIAGRISDEGLRKDVLEKNDEAKFLESKVETARFFADNILPEVYGDLQVIRNKGTSCLSDVL